MTPVRLPGVDALKALACVLIVWHHLAFYGPMSDVVHLASPAPIAWLYDHARMAVQVFLVVGGFLAAASLAPQGQARVANPWRAILRRYQRLAPPLLVAVGASVLVAAWLRPWFDHDSVPDAPDVWQLLAHVFFLQDLLGLDALSAGIWYVAIDLQLFALTAVALTLLPGSRHRWLLLSLAAGSLLAFNRDPALDVSALYFFGAYGLGMLAWWTVRAARPRPWLAGLLALGLAALALDFRARLLLALVVALGLVWLQRSSWAAEHLQPGWVEWLSQRSYSIFLIHFPVCLVVNAVFARWWADGVLANALGMVLAFGLSLLAGAGLYRWVEAPGAGWRGLVRLLALPLRAHPRILVTSPTAPPAPHSSTPLPCPRTPGT